MTHSAIAHHIQFSDVVLYQWLLDIGLTPNKSKTIGALSVPDEFFFDFLRGHLDGDGTILKYPDPVYPNALRLYVNFISASLAHIEWIQGRIALLSDLKGYVQNGVRIFKLVYAKRESIRLLHRLYPSPVVPCLERKRDIAQEFLNLDL